MVEYYLKIDKYTVHHNKLYYSHQHMLHALVITDHSQTTNKICWFAEYVYKFLMRYTAKGLIIKKIVKNTTASCGKITPRVKKRATSHRFPVIQSKTNCFMHYESK